jgi:hypothetical protein
MWYKPIKNCHVKNAILGKDLNLGAIGSFIHAFTPHASIEKKKKEKKRIIVYNTFFGTSSMKRFVELKHLELLSTYLKKLLM